MHSLLGLFFGIGPIEMLILAAITFVMLGAGVAVLVAIAVTAKKRRD